MRETILGPSSPSPQPYAGGAVLPAPGPGGGGRGPGQVSGGILVSDFYASYDHYPGLKQRCWAHPVSSTGQALLRDIHKLKALYPEDAVLTKWAHGVRRLYDRPGGSWSWKRGCWRCAVHSWKTRWRSRASSAAGLSVISKACPVLDTGNCLSSCRTRRRPLTIMRRNGTCGIW